MRFLTFVQQNAKQSDPALKSFANFFINRYPPHLSSDPRILALQLYNKLTHLQTTGFQLFMIMYSHESKNQIALELKIDHAAFLEAINRIVELQNNDPNYKSS